MDLAPVPDCDGPAARRAERAAVEPVLAGRAKALADCRAAVLRGRGPVLLTGEAGSGKTWLWRRLASACPEAGRWLGVDASPTDDGAALIRRVLRSLGRDDPAGLDDPDAALAEELAERAEEGRRWVLVVDEAQNLGDPALEAFRLLTNRHGTIGGFAGLLLVGRTGLSRRLAARRWESLDARIALHARLGPIDADEAAVLLAWSLPGRAWGRDRLDTLHAQVLGNPSRLLRLADQDRPAPAAPSAAQHRPRPAAVEPRPPARPFVEAPVPMLDRERPPLRFEDGLIEVGWEGPEDDAPEPTAPEPATAAPAPIPEPAPEPASVVAESGPEVPAQAEAPVERYGIEAIEDPYAALQARDEWSRARESASTADVSETAVEEVPAPGSPIGSRCWTSPRRSAGPVSTGSSRPRNSPRTADSSRS